MLVQFKRVHVQFIYVCMSMSVCMMENTTKSDDESVDNQDRGKGK